MRIITEIKIHTTYCDDYVIQTIAYIFDVTDVETNTFSYSVEIAHFYIEAEQNYLLDPIDPYILYNLPEPSE